MHHTDNHDRFGCFLKKTDMYILLFISYYAYILYTFYIEEYISSKQNCKKKGPILGSGSGEKNENGEILLGKLRKIERKK